MLVQTSPHNGNYNWSPVNFTHYYIGLGGGGVEYANYSNAKEYQNARDKWNENECPYLVEYCEYLQQ